MNKDIHKPLVFLVSAPSGAGKTTLCNALLEDSELNFSYSVSCTTRPARDGEREGENYHFLDEATFKEKVAADEFLEWAEVHANYYGTLVKSVAEPLWAGQNVLLDLDVQGAAQIRKNLQKLETLAGAFVFSDIFILPPSIKALEERFNGTWKR